jgi:hypothetical protein
MRCWGFLKSVGSHSDNAREAYEPLEKDRKGEDVGMVAEEADKIGSISQ